MANQRRNLRDSEKKWLLGEIRCLKDILFGGHGEKLDNGSEITEEMKKKAWQDLYDDCASQNFPFCRDGRDGSFLRFKTWPNLKEGTKKKLDNRNFTGRGGGI